MLKKYLLLFLSLSAIAAQAQIKFDVQGHRGARGIMPENTVAGMLKALDLGVNTLMMNVVISHDKLPLLSHEPYFNQEITTTPEGKTITLKDEKTYNIYQMDYDRIKQFDVGEKIHPRFPGQQKFAAYKPLLSDVIDSVERYVKLKKLPKPEYNIETKAIPKGDNVFQPEPGEYVDLVMKVIRNKKIESRVTISSFDIRTLQYLHQKYPKIKTALMIDEQENFEKNIADLGFKPAIYSPYSILVGKSLVDRCHAMGIKIIPWTVNNSTDIKYLMNIGVDGIITDYPNVMKVIKDELSP